MENEFLDTMQAGTLTHLHANHISRLATQGVIPSIKIGKRRLFKRSDLLKWMRQQNRNSKK
jgi:excisionase family DNA binding protein